jgi:uncharacterized protein (DUF885 family)
VQAAETVADLLIDAAMGLYDSDLTRAGYLVHILDVAMGAYLDIGYHTRGWTREMLVDSMMVLGGRPRAMA